LRRDVGIDWEPSQYRENSPQTHHAEPARGRRRQELMTRLVQRAAALAFALGTLTIAAHAQDAQHAAHGNAAAAVPIIEGLGSYHRPISSRNPETQQYFDQGLRLTYAFNHLEAIRAFEEAARRDSTCAICWWGVA